MFDLAVAGERAFLLSDQFAVLGQQQRPQRIDVERAEIGRRRCRSHASQYASK
jgi:hypothetical protein